MRRVAAVATVVVLLSGCATDDNPPLPGEEPAARGPAIIVSLPLLANVVEQIVDGHGRVTTLYPDGRPGVLSDAQQNQVANADLVLVHGLDGEAPVLAAAQGTPDGPPPPRLEVVNEWLEQAPVTVATWFDPILMARIALGLGDVLAAIDDEGTRTADEWHETTEQVATAIATIFDEATEQLANVPAECRRARGDEDLLAHLGARFGVRAARPEDTGAADLSDVAVTLADGETWQDWFGAIIAGVTTASPDCAPLVTPSPSPSGGGSGQS
ncbi:MAG TPA: zinc ABC transporter substrate-binding protein [Nitriliruptorales bacterium]